MSENEQVETETEEETTEEETEEKVQKINVKIDASEMTKIKEEVNGLKELIVSSFKEMKEKAEVVKKQEQVDNTKGIVSEKVEKTSEVASNEYVVENADFGNGFALYGNYDNSKFKRLSR